MRIFPLITHLYNSENIGDIPGKAHLNLLILTANPKIVAIINVKILIVIVLKKHVHVTQQIIQFSYIFNPGAIK